MYTEQAMDAMCIPDTGMKPDTDSMTPSELAAAIRSGSLPAFETAFRALSPAMAVFISRYCLDHDHAHDLVQEAFFRLWQARATIRPEKGIKSYLFTILLNLWRDECRKRSVPEFPSERMDLYQHPRPGIPEDIDEDTSPTLVILRTTLNTLSDDDRAMLFLVKTGGLTCQEAATIFAVNEKTVRRRITRFVDTLSNRLGETPLRNGGICLWLLIA